MKALAFACLLVPTVAAADNTAIDVSFGLDARGRAGSVEATADAETHGRAAARIMIEFEPPPSRHVEFHFVPELFAWTSISDRDAEGSLGAGLRAEVFGPTKNPRIRGAGVYVALRGQIMGPNRDPAVELALGHYFERWNGWRVGCDTGVVLRDRDEASPDRARELDVLLSLVVGRR